LNRAIPRDLELICLKAMNKEPAARYQKAAEMADDLQRFHDGMPIKARRYRILELAWRAARRRVAISAMTLMALAAVTGIAWLWWTTPKTSESPDAPRLVHLETNPSRARIVFVPISQFDGEPDPKRAIKAPGVTPIEMKLQPGDYWVEAVVSDGWFHEVVRHVPKLGEWDAALTVVGPGETIGLKPIEIPDKSVTSNMIYVPNEDGTPFYVDANTSNAADLQAKYGATYVAKGASGLCLQYSDAKECAEQFGKRLPTDAEWRRAQGVLPPRTAKDMGEWTDSLELLPDNNGGLLLRGFRYCECHVVRGGSRNLIAGKTDLSPSDFAAENFVAIPTKGTAYPGIAVRCIRSATPRYLSLIEKAEVPQ
jgi:hypothetical protein